MATEVKILVEGVTNADSVVETGEEHTQPTITLVRDGDLIMVVDPGILKNQDILVDALAKENLTVQDVNLVFITHSHFDHYRNIGMFPNAKTLEYFGLWSKDTVENWSENFTPNIQVLHTPGHDYTSLSLLVTMSPESEYPGTVAICGDVFWKKSFPLEPHDDAYASNPERLKESREMILRTADWIIPGHGGIYKNDKSVELKKEFKKKTEKGSAKDNGSRITITCKKCSAEMKQHDKCLCRPYLCFRCCQCGYDCPACGCSHKK